MEIRCSIREKWVTATPEEEVRQKLISKMISELGYPKSLISVEKEIASLPSGGLGMGRRLDLICYTPNKEKLVPLLIAECKAVSLDEGAERQVFGYNSTIQAPFLCLAGKSEIKTLWMSQGKIASVPFLPFYKELLKGLCY